jgi:DNA-directed RNA polymerase specialized sigma subunit
MPEDGAAENLLEYCMMQLEELEQNIVKALLDDHTQRETAEICRTSQATVSRCLAKLRKTVLGELKK